MAKCDRCPMPAVIHQRYSGMHLCQSHFADDVHRKVRESLRHTGLFAGSLRLAMSMDGGKGSSVMAHILKSLFDRRKDIDLVAIIIEDQGPGAGAARLIAEKLGIQSVIVDMLDMPAAQGQIWGGGETSPGPGSSELKIEMACRLAQEIKADALAVGHDLDDEATGIFVSYLEGDIAGLMDKAREGRRAQGERAQEKQAQERKAQKRQAQERQDKEGYSQALEGLIPCVRPLRRIPKKEVRLYAIRHGLCFTDDEKEDALHKEARQQLSLFDRSHPGTKYSLLRSQEKLSRDSQGIILGSRSKAFK